MMADHGANTSARLGDLMSRVTAPGTQCTVGISGARGQCPLGFMQEDVWEVDAAGRPAYPLCPSAVEAIRPLLKK